MKVTKNIRGKFVKFRMDDKPTWLYYFVTDVVLNESRQRLLGHRLPNLEYASWRGMSLARISDIEVITEDEVIKRFDKYGAKGFKLLPRYFCPSNNYYASQVDNLDKIKSIIKLGRFKVGATVVLRNVQWGKTSYRHSYNGISQVVGIDYDKGTVEVVAMWDNDLTRTFSCHPKHLLLTLKSKHEKPLDKMAQKANLEKRLKAIAAKDALIEYASEHGEVATILRDMGWVE